MTQALKEKVSCLEEKIESLEREMETLERDNENLDIRVESLEEQQQSLLEKMATYSEFETKIDGGISALKIAAAILTFVATVGHCIPIDY